MRFDRLRLHGFKSFVDPTELEIREGLTGVVGPNGCGKSNLLEALRWVMGENRPTAMRGDEMEDVIFAGTSRRTARAHAEVALVLDNRNRLAPAAFNSSDHIEVIRRITRDAGSAYRIAGKEARARDVQMLFADASTGAHSPALVRQGQISELIAARPRSRRRILEEAAGISGLYQRRHEAELTLNRTDANLGRVDDTLDQLTAQASALTRQARTAARYRTIGAALRQAETWLLWRRWSQAAMDARTATQALATAKAAAAGADRAHKAAAVDREAADAALPALREEEQIAAALSARHASDLGAVEQAIVQADAALGALVTRRAQLDRDMAREDALNQDTVRTVAELQAEHDTLVQAGQGHPDVLAEAARTAELAAADLVAAEAQLAELTGAAARLAAQHHAARQQVDDLQTTVTRAAAAAEAAVAEADRADAAGKSADGALSDATAAQTGVRTAARLAEADLAERAAARVIADTEETATRTDRAAATAEHAALTAEMSALDRLIGQNKSDDTALLHRVRVAPGHEAAFAAAFADAMHLGPGATPAESGWHALPTLNSPLPPLPGETTPLARHVVCPDVMMRRLFLVGLTPDAATGSRLQARLQPGQRLVTPEGDLFRWDGLRVLAGQAISATALHLRNVNRLADLQVRAEAASVRMQTAIARHTAALTRQRDSVSAETAARDACRRAERQLADQNRVLSNAESMVSRAAARAGSAQDDLARQRAKVGEARMLLAEAEAALAALPDDIALTRALDQTRVSVEAARIATMTRRAALDDLRRETQARDARMRQVDGDLTRWIARRDQAGAHRADLAARRDAVDAELAQAQAQPGLLAHRREALIDRAGSITERAGRARAALGAGETTLRDAVAAERQAERVASDARVAEAADRARAEAAEANEASARARVMAETGQTPQALHPALSKGDATEADTPLPMLEERITRLRASRDALGAVNLRAEDDRRDIEAQRDLLAAEKNDLQQAIQALRAGIASLNREGRERLLAAFETVNGNFATLFRTLFGGGEARLALVESDDPLEAGLEIMCQPPGKKLSTLSLLSGGEQTLTAMALIFAVFLANPAPICVLDEVDAPLDDANVSRFCDLLDAMTRRTDTRFLIITHHGVTMARMDRLFGVTMVEQGVSQLVSVDLTRATALVA